MKNQVLHLNKTQGRELAEEYFRDMCGYNRGKPVSQKKIEKSLKSLENIDDRINIRALISEYDQSCVSGACILPDGEQFTCRGLDLLPAGELERIYVYLLTVGELDIREPNLLNTIYYDLWQNAYMDTGQELLREYLQGLDCNRDKYVSSNFGPGYFDMDISQLEKFFNLLDGEKIGVKLLESGFMSPSKSYAGFFIVMKSQWDFAENNCESCIASGKTCIYCKAGRKKA